MSLLPSVPNETLDWLIFMSHHFKVQYLYIQMACGLILIFAAFFSVSRRSYWAAILFMLPFLVMNLSAIVPYWFPHERPPQPASYIDRLGIFLINQGSITDARPLIKQINASDADMVAITEHATLMAKAMDAPDLVRRYPYRFYDLQLQLGLYSRVAFTRTKRMLQNPGMSLAVTIKPWGVPTTVLLSHPVVPYSSKAYQHQLHHYQQWIKDRRQYEASLILLGDFNNTPWTESFQQVRRALSLKDTQYGFGPQATWHLEDFWMLPIDHILISDPWVTLDRRVLPDIGSDHRPVYVELGLKPAGR